MSRSTGAQLAFGIAGAAAGYFAGSPALGFSIGASIGGALFPEELPAQFGPRLEDKSVSGSGYGIPIPIVFGSYRLSTSMIWVDPNGKKETAYTEAAGKGTPTPETTTYTYSLSAAFMICEGEITAIRRIWINNNLVYTRAEDATGNDIYASEKLAAANITVYTGSETQEPSALQESFEGAGNVPAYRGIAYIEFEDLQLGPFGNGAINVDVEVIKDATETTFPTLVHTLTEDNGWRNSIGIDGGFRCVDYTANTPSNQQVLMHDRYFDYSGTYLVDNSYLLDTGTTTAYQFDPCYNDPRYVFGAYASGVSLIKMWYQGQYMGYLNYPSGYYELYSWDTSIGGIKGCCRLGDYLITLATGRVVSGGALGWTIIRHRILLDGTIANDPDIHYRLNEDLGYTSTPGPYISADDNQEYFYIFAGTGAGTECLVKFDSNLRIINQWSAAQMGSVPMVDNRRFVVRDSGKGYSWCVAAYTTAGPSHHIIICTFDPETSGSAFTSIYDNTSRSFTTNAHVTTMGNGFFKLEDYIFSLDDLIPQAGEALSDVVTVLCGKAGLTDLAVTALSGDTVKGYAVSREMSARAAIEPLQRSYFFDMPLYDAKLNAVKRGGSSIRTILSDDMAAHRFGSVTPDVMTITRGGEKELAKKVVVKYIEQSSDYQINAQQATKVSSQSENIQTVNVPLVFSADEAAQIADITLNAQYAERERTSFSLSTENIELTPADVVTANGIRTRITETKVETFGPILINGVVDFAAAYTSSVTGIASTAGGGTIQFPGTTVLYLLDIPLLRDQDDNGGMYAAVIGYSSGWGGSVIYKSVDGGVSYSELETITTKSTVGRATDALADNDAAGWDWTNTVNIRPAEGQTISSDSEINVLNGANAAILGTPGAWEVIQWVTATDEGDGTYTLSQLLRGRKGTEYNTGNHAAGDTFIILNTTATRFLITPSSEIGSARLYKPVSFGNLLQNADAKSYTYTGETLTPLSPCNIVGTRDGSNNLTITWDRRSRYDYTSLMYLPLGEETEEYQVDIYDNSATPVFLRTVSPNPTSETASYTAAQQTDDLITPGDPVNVKIYQVSATVGNGHAGEALI